jgi:hypothetical protein
MRARMRGIARQLRLALAACLVAASGCAIAGSTPARIGWFEEPAPGDPWAGVIASWRERERTPAVAAPRPDTELARAYASFQTEERRGLARRVLGFVQEQARWHFVPDGPFDHWATLAETLERGGDDCDGLELLAYRFLLAFGFPREQVLRAVLRGPGGSPHHMVTLWFEDPGDPWVLDPTGIVTGEFVRMSSIRDWQPVRLFGDEVDYAVEIGPSPPPDPQPTAAPAPE